MASDPGDFQPALAYAGKRDGRVFKNGDKGLGYYIDSRVRGQRHPPEARHAGQEGATAKQTQRGEER
eukprot:43740-Prorocentrum_lima.AAC.1